MPSRANESANTLLEAVQQSLLRAARFDPGTLVAPAAVLWTDADGQWQPLVSQLRPLMPELLILGEYNPEEKKGPAIWLRCVIEGMLSEVELPNNPTPIIYLPKVGRQMLRAGEDCPETLKPLVELQYRGTVWTQRNGRDWTVEAFLVSEDGLGLDVARDKQTHQAMLRALPQLANAPIARLQGKRLEAEDFDKLMVADTPRDLLSWLNGSDLVREEWGKDKWEAFCSRCKYEYGFDPEGHGELTAAEKLGLRVSKEWEAVWDRYAESPVLYPRIPELLSNAKPTGMIYYRESWPDENEKDENLLRQSLLELEGLSPAVARQRIEELEQKHGLRREWIWARLGKSPLAEALKHLVILAQRTTQGLGGASPREMADLYMEGGYLADDAALRAVGSVKFADDVRAAQIAVRSIYLSWLEDVARHFQELLATAPLPNIAANGQPSIAANPGQCLLFIDGLRFDIAQRLAIMAAEKQLQIDADWRWAALPTVTATAKYAVSPVAEKLSGKLTSEDFTPTVDETTKPLTSDRFRKLLTEAGYQVFSSPETGRPNEPEARGWTEFGEFDKLGHSLQSGLAARIDEQLDLILERVQDLLAAGWRQVRIVTDHGWLLVPGGLPATQLPKYLTESRWTRCASIRAGARVDVPTAEWYWDAGQHFAFAPGVYCFVKGNEYAHGGVSLQECLVPDLTLSSSEFPRFTARIMEIKWVGMRCRITADTRGANIIADLRTKPNDSDSSITTPKQIDSTGQVGLLVPDESLEGTIVSVVLLGPTGRVLAKQATTVGGEE